MDFTTNQAKKWMIFFAILFLGTALDQWTKSYAESRLAFAGRDWQHKVILTVDATHEGQTLLDFLKDEFSYSTTEEIQRMAQIFVRDEQGMPMRPNQNLHQGDKVQVLHRTATVIQGYFDFVYARNPGAAWSFLANAPEQFRFWFFRIMAVVALTLIVVLFYRLKDNQWLLILGLSLVASGALGNLLDRFQNNYVIDFIVWHVHDHYWPTFNLADVWISIGVALMFFDILKQRREQPSEASVNAQ